MAVPARSGTVRFGSHGLAGQGEDRQGPVGFGEAVTVWLGRAWCGKATRGKVWQSRSGKARHGGVR